MIRKLFSVVIWIAAIAALQSCAKSLPPQESCNFVQNGELQRVSWGSATPIVMHIDSGVPNAYYNAIHAAADKWNLAIGREVIKIGGVVQTDGVPKQDGANVIYVLRSWEPERTNEQARTTVYWAGDRIFEADVRINAHDFDFFTDTPVAGKVDIQSLILHEFGHVLGLVHTDTPQSVMVRSLPSATKRRDLSSDDLKSIRCEY